MKYGTHIMGSGCKCQRQGGGCNHVTLASSAARIRSPTHEWAPTLPSLPFPILPQLPCCAPECPVTGVEPIVSETFAFQPIIFHRPHFSVFPNWMYFHISLLHEIDILAFSISSALPH